VLVDDVAAATKGQSLGITVKGRHTGDGHGLVFHHRRSTGAHLGLWETKKK
jgi:hypothetical protein